MRDQQKEIEPILLDYVERYGPCSMEQLIQGLPDYTWSQVFSAIDRLSRTARIVLRHPARFDYFISAVPPWAGEQSVTDSSAVQAEQQIPVG